MNQIIAKAKEENPNTYWRQILVDILETLDLIDKKYTGDIKISIDGGMLVKFDKGLLEHGSVKSNGLE
jgi:CTP:phosphocholine cytidylyltransferase-like protein